MRLAERTAKKIVCRVVSLLRCPRKHRWGIRSLFVLSLNDCETTSYELAGSQRIPRGPTQVHDLAGSRVPDGGPGSKMRFQLSVQIRSLHHSHIFNCVREQRIKIQSPNLTWTLKWPSHVCRTRRGAQVVFGQAFRAWLKMPC